MTTSLTRRQSLAALLAGAAAPALPAAAARPKAASPSLFHHGVASGDPDQTSVVLWTRITTGQQAIAVRWEVSETADFAQITRAGETIAHRDVDHTVKVVADGLQPGRRYHYRFHAAGVKSPAGRTLTLASGHLDRLGIALASCSNYVFGRFNAYDAIARDPDIDLVLHTGDYIYEYGNDGWGADVAKRTGRAHDPAHEIVTLDDYRRRHAQYKADPGSRAMHAAHPLLALWDDHESANNPWTGGAQNHQPATEGRWEERRAAAIRAYYEWMPIREPGDGQTRLEFWRAYRFGDLATLVTLETRHTGRGEQVDYEKHAPSIRSKAEADAFERDILGDPRRAMLSRAMERFFEDRITASVNAGEPWRIIGNAIPMARTRVPDVVAAGLIADPASEAKPLPAARELAWKGKWNLPFYPDTWDGYPAARERFYASARKAGASDLLVLTGDSHSFWANRLSDDAGRPMGIELGTAGITSPGDFVASGFETEVARKLDRAFEDHNPEIRWTDNLHQGYVRLLLTHDEGRADFIAMSTLQSESYEAQLLRTERFARTGGSLDFKS